MLFVFFFSIEVEAVYFNGQIAIRAFFFSNKFQLEYVFLYSLYSSTARAKLHLKPKDIVWLKTHLKYSVIDYQKKHLVTQLSYTMHVLLPYNTLFLCEGCLTFPVAVKCYLHLLIWHLFLSRGWTEFVALFSARSSSEHTAWPFPARCHQHASPPLQNKEKKLYILCIKSNKRRRHWVSDTWSFSKMIV